jgi:hypothetical protein
MPVVPRQRGGVAGTAESRCVSPDAVPWVAAPRRDGLARDPLQISETFWIPSFIWSDTVGPPTAAVSPPPQLQLRTPNALASALTGMATPIATLSEQR